MYMIFLLPILAASYINEGAQNIITPIFAAINFYIANTAAIIIYGIIINFCDQKNLDTLLKHYNRLSAIMLAILSLFTLIAYIVMHFSFHKSVKENVLTEFYQDNSENYPASFNLGIYLEEILDSKLQAILTTFITFCTNVFFLYNFRP